MSNLNIADAEHNWSKALDALRAASAAAVDAYDSAYGVAHATTATALAALDAYHDALDALDAARVAERAALDAARDAYLDARAAALPVM